jgi:sugar (pentulose or hexulose) kinase
MPASADLVIGLDSSTSGCKAIVWDLTGHPLGQGRASLTMQMARPGWHEQNAEEWWTAACAAIHQAIASVDPKQIRAISIAHQRETFVPVDRSGHPLRPALLWLDQRAAPLLPDLAHKLDPIAYQQRTGKPLSANLAPGKLEWLRREEPDLYQAASYFLDTHAFLVQRLTGTFKTSTASADPLGLYNFATQTWDEATLEVIGLSSDKLPEIVPAGQILGHLNAAAASQTGLSAGLAVVAGLGDGQAGSLGSGLASTRDASISMGTSVIGGFSAPRWVTSPAFRTMAGPDPNAYILETVLLGGTYTLQWLIADLLAEKDFASAFAALETAAVVLPPGSNGLMLVPYWSGVMNPYWDASASGILVGLRGIHQRQHIFRAILEGIAFELRLQLEGVEAALGTPIQRLLVSGGGAQSQLWRQILASVCNRPVYQCGVIDAAALGAGILAATAMNLHPNLPSAVESMVRVSLSPSLPESSSAHVYTQLYDNVYCQLYPTLREALNTLARLSA